MNSNTDNVRVVLAALLKELDIPVTGVGLAEEIEKHPESNSLLAVSDLLNNWMVPNAAYKIKLDFLEELPTPFVAHLRNNEFAVISAIDPNHFVATNHAWNHTKIKRKDFSEIYGGTVLVAEKQESSGELDYSKKRKRELIEQLRYPFVILAILFLLVSYFFLSPAFSGFIAGILSPLFFIKLAGTAVSVLLLLQSIDQTNPLIVRLCNGSGNSDCNAILSSPAAKVTDEISWSEIGFFYFMGTSLVLLFHSGDMRITAVLGFFNLFCLPYTIYSIYYQMRIAGKWCLFCCAIQVILWLEFFAFLRYIRRGFPNLTLMELANLLVCLCVPVLLWIVIKPFLLKDKQLEPLKAQLQKFKYNGELFNKLLDEEVRYALPAPEDSIMLGMPDALHTVTIVSNPHCQPCARAHNTLEKWLSKRDDIKLQVVFFINGEKDSSSWAVAAHLLALQANSIGSSVKMALEDWNTAVKKDLAPWMKRHPLKEAKDVENVLRIQDNWCELTDIVSTPTIFINGRKLPYPYLADDIKYFIYKGTTKKLPVFGKTGRGMPNPIRVAN